MLLVAGISIRNLQPRFWDPEDPLYVPGVDGVMVSYSDFIAMPWLAARVKKEGGLKKYLGIPRGYRVFLDNGAFYTLSHKRKFDVRGYRGLVDAVEPDWCPIPVEHIPHPSMSRKAQHAAFLETMKYNNAYGNNGHVPVIHVGDYLSEFLDRMERFAARHGLKRLGLGAMVPFLLRSKGADCRNRIVDDIVTVRKRLPQTRIHGFGIGGTATLHIASILGLDSVDSAGWRNRAARGIVQLLGKGDRIVGKFGSWRGRKLDTTETASLSQCRCGACRNSGHLSLYRNGIEGFAARACHNLWVLTQELREIAARRDDPRYAVWLKSHIDNVIFKPLLDHALKQCATTPAPEQIA